MSIIARAKRSGITVSLDDTGSTLPDLKQDTERLVEGKALLEQAARVATRKEDKIVQLLVDGFALHEAARILKIPRAAVVSCMENFFYRARTAIG